MVGMVFRFSGIYVKFLGTFFLLRGYGNERAIQNYTQDVGLEMWL